MPGTDAKTITTSRPYFWPIASIAASFVASGIFVYGIYNGWPHVLIAMPLFIAGQINGAMVWKNQ